jgi:ABC-2 type transport system permease protein
MAVYERTYKGYTGETTAQRWRWTVLPRYAVRDVFRSRLFLAFFVLCFVVPLVLLAAIYLRASFEALDSVELPFAIFEVDGDLFYRFLQIQGWLAFVVTLFVGPGLVSRDLANNGLPLYLSRPFSRAEYVLGKASVLAVLLSAITWVPGLVLFAFQGSLVDGWALSHLRWAWAIFAGSWVWIIVLTLLALAFSAWVRWRMIAAFLLVATVFVGWFGAAIFRLLFRTEWGDLVMLPQMTWNLWSALLGIEPTQEVPVLASALAVIAYAVAALLLLRFKLRAYEVVS